MARQRRADGLRETPIVSEPPYRDVGRLDERLRVGNGVVRVPGREQETQGPELASEAAVRLHRGRPLTGELDREHLVEHVVTGQVRHGAEGILQAADPPCIRGGRPPGVEQRVQSFAQDPQDSETLPQGEVAPPHQPQAETVDAVHRVERESVEQPGVLDC